MGTSDVTSDLHSYKLQLVAGGSKHIIDTATSKDLAVINKS
jgi:hypothetical protein